MPWLDARAVGIARAVTVLSALCICETHGNRVGREAGDLQSFPDPDGTGTGTGEDEELSSFTTSAPTAAPTSVPAPTHPRTATGCSYIVGHDYTGPNLRHGQHAPNVERCAELCVMDADCQYFTHVGTKCYMKGFFDNLASRQAWFTAGNCSGIEVPTMPPTPTPIVTLHDFDWDQGFAQHEGNTDAPELSQTVLAEPMPQALTETACAFLDDTIYTIGAYAPYTYRYNVIDGVSGKGGEWDKVQSRLHKGNHHFSTTFEGKWYLIGGFHAGEKSVQVYTPSTNKWSDMIDYPGSGLGSYVGAVLGNEIYICSGLYYEHISTIYQGNGLNKNANPTDCWRFNVHATAPNTTRQGVWSRVPDIPVGVNHAASGKFH